MFQRKFLKLISQPHDFFQYHTSSHCFQNTEQLSPTPVQILLIFISDLGENFHRVFAQLLQNQIGARQQIKWKLKKQSKNYSKNFSTTTCGNSFRSCGIIFNSTRITNFLLMFCLLVFFMFFSSREKEVNKVSNLYDSLGKRDSLQWR